MFKNRYAEFFYMSFGQCHVCREQLLEISYYELGKMYRIDEAGYCKKCKEIRYKCEFFMKFGFEPWEMQDSKESLTIDGHTLIWKSIGDEFQYHCTTCNRDLLQSHNHIPPMTKETKL